MSEPDLFSDGSDASTDDEFADVLQTSSGSGLESEPGSYVPLSKEEFLKEAFRTKRKGNFVVVYRKAYLFCVLSLFIHSSREVCQ